MEIPFFSLKGPSVKEIINYTDKTITFNGYFRYEDELFTKERHVHRFVYLNNDILYVAIVGVKRGNDTSEYWTDDEEEEMRICLTPTEIITLEYEILEKNPTRERYHELYKYMNEEETNYMDLNEELYKARMKREWENNT
jgi:hypothetical protein